MEMSTEATSPPPRMSAARLARREAARHAPLDYRRVHPEALGNALRLHLIVHTAAAFGLTWFHHVPFLSPLTAEQIAMQAYCWLMSSILFLNILGVATGTASVAVAQFSLARLLPIPRFEFLRSGIAADTRLILRQLMLTFAISIVLCFATSRFSSEQFWYETTGLVLRLWPWGWYSSTLVLLLSYLGGVIFGHSAGRSADATSVLPLVFFMVFVTSSARQNGGASIPRIAVTTVFVVFAAFYSWRILRPRDCRGRA